MERKDEKTSDYKTLIIRCPRLGGEVPFAYCEKEGGDLPCRMVVGCWEGIFLVENHLRETLSEEAWIRLNSQPPKDKLTNILDIVEKAKKRIK
ncbi:MAG: hypothetical protein K0B01_09045 [Syntrophobacterales bacterium]|nr:hypothetical protein [Syntrophobacterales bacterium]